MKVGGIDYNDDVSENRPSSVSPKTVGERMRADPLLLNACDEIRRRVSVYRNEIASVRPPLDSLRMDYETAIRTFEEERGAALFYPFLGSGIGHGAYVELSDGSIKYDFISGIGAHVLGHDHPELLEASLKAAVSDTVMQGNLQQNRESSELAGLLLNEADRSGARMAHCFLSSSGAMANENALKIILQKKHPARRMLAFDRAFAGRTTALLSITDNPGCREGIPVLMDVDRVPFHDETDPDGSSARAEHRLRELLETHPGEYAGMHLELVQGEAGFHPGTRAFFTPLLDLLKQHHIAIWFDEIQTLGRTTELFAYQHFGLDEYPDLVTLGKLSPVCATLFREEYRPRPGLISQTFTSSTASLFASLHILPYLRNAGFFGADGRIATLSRVFQSRLSELAARHPRLVRGPFGYGMMIACTVFDGDPARTRTFLKKLFEAGVIAFYAGISPLRVRFLPPFAVLDETDIQVVCDIFESTLLTCEEEASCS